MEKTQTHATHLIPQVAEIRARACELEQSHKPELAKVLASQRDSARNLVHYLALRQTDVRQLQHDLSALGLSSLGRAEANVLNTLNTVLIALHRLAQLAVPPELLAPAPVDAHTGPKLLNNHSDALFGIASGKRTVRIMVTMPSQAATQPTLVHALLAAGMDVMRINCAHDGPEVWQAMIDNLRLAEQKLGQTCKVSIDLAGPKLRTGLIPPLTRLLKVKPLRNALGQVTQPAKVHFVLNRISPSAAGSGADTSPHIPISDEMIQQAQVGDVFKLKDAREKKRRFRVVETHAAGCFAVTDQTAYIITGAAISLKRAGKVLKKGVIGDLPELIEPLLLKLGDVLVVTKEGQQASHNAPAGLQISCTLPEVFDAVKVGEAIWFDDGKIGGHVVSADHEQIKVAITHTGLAVGKLTQEKGINLPDTDINVPALTAKDLIDLDYVASRADIIGMSFVRTPEDVQQLANALAQRNASEVGIMLKIETRLAFENLPRLLLAAMQSPNVGVMIARGDLAVELGFERMAEVQEEILWLCEAAHVPVIWATQVLESMAKSGAPTRAEVSDAAMSGRAECVMLNKGPFIVETVHFLDGLLERMSAHQSKKRSMLRRLAVAAS